MDDADSKRYLRNRITRTEVALDGALHVVTFELDGVHITQKWARSEDVIPYARLVQERERLGKVDLAAVAETSPKPKKANRALKDGSVQEQLDRTANDLSYLAETINAHGKIDGEALADVRKQLMISLKAVRELESKQ